MGSGSSSRFVIKLIEGSDPLDALKEQIVVKQLILGISYIEDSKFLEKYFPKTYVHTALFISSLDKNQFGQDGILLEYGNYDSKDDNEGKFNYECEDGGMRYGFIKLDEFEKGLAPTAHVTLDIDTHSFMLFKELIDELKKKGKWDKQNYNVITNNCQDFCAKVIEILKAKYLDICIKETKRISKGYKLDIIPSKIKVILEKNNKKK